MVKSGAAVDLPLVIEGRVRIEAPAARAFAFISDLENYPKWFPGIGQMAAVDDAPIGTIGKRYREVAYLGNGAMADINVEVVAYAPGRHLAIHADLGPVLPRFDYTVEAIGEGACDFHWSCRARAAGPEAEARIPVMKTVLTDRLKRALATARTRIEARPGTLMRASVMRRFGRAEDVVVLDEEHPRPAIPDTGVLVRQIASSINKIDLARRNGYGRVLMEARGAGGFPGVLGVDVFGVVEAVGPAAKGVQIGDTVFGAKPPSREGAWAEYVVVEPAQIARVPAGVRDDFLATTPYVFQTAWATLVRHGGLTRETAAGKRIFVQGAAGAVGSMAVQLARAWGAHVSGSCLPGEEVIARDLGVDEVFVSGRDDYAASLRDVDLAVCTADALEQDRMISILARGRQATYATVIHPTLRLADELGVEAGLAEAGRQKAALRELHRADGKRIEWVLFQPDPDALVVLSQLLSSGSLRSLIAREVGLDDLAAAQTAEETGAPTKTVIRIRR